MFHITNRFNENTSKCKIWLKRTEYLVYIESLTFAYNILSAPLELGLTDPFFISGHLHKTLQTGIDYYGGHCRFVWAPGRILNDRERRTPSKLLWNSKGLIIVERAGECINAWKSIVCREVLPSEPQSDLELFFADIVLVVYSPCAGGLSCPDSE
jgi:hypothetical protein